MYVRNRRENIKHERSVQNLNGVEIMKFEKTCRCPNCFFVYQIPYLNGEPFDGGVLIEKRCWFCEQNINMSSYGLLIRRLDVLDKTYASDFPAIIRHLVKHISLSEEIKNMP